MSEQKGEDNRFEALERRLTEAERQIAFLVDRARREDDLRRLAAEREFGPVDPP